MLKKLTYEELEKRVRELEKEGAERKSIIAREARPKQSPGNRGLLHRLLIIPRNDTSEPHAIRNRREKMLQIDDLQVELGDMEGYL
jgi:hypothetical protein